ncbi:hypothetical protein [Campylobacter sp. MG1]|uniref:hypothetical protein n=1 Tax=Campylobacter sp. MG1 TaxID=2976332 RepID=UPI00226D08EE|nr:hypothetical protein [Campylobacter sp. MG1]
MSDKNKNKTLAKTWGNIKDVAVLYEDCRMKVICSNYHRYGIKNAVGIHWREVRDENGDMIHNAYPVQGSAYCPLHLNDNLTLILLKGLLNSDLYIKVTEENKGLIKDLIIEYEQRVKDNQK